jgi:hypothetical protein
MTENNELEQLREQTETGSRIEETASDDAGDELQEAIVDELDAIDDKEVSPNLTLRDKNMAALVRGLEEVDRLDEVGAALDRELGNEPAEEYNRADIGRLAIRIALQDVEPGLLESLEDAVAEQMQI